MHVSIDEVRQVLGLVGILCDKDDPYEKIIIKDSLQYISAIVELETVFGIAFEDEYLDGSAFESIYYLTEIINELMAK